MAYCETKERSGSDLWREAVEVEGDAVRGLYDFDLDAKKINDTTSIWMNFEGTCG